MGAPDSPWAGLWAQVFFNSVAKAKPSKAKNKMSLNDQNVYFNKEIHFDRRTVITAGRSLQYHPSFLFIFSNINYLKDGNYRPLSEWTVITVHSIDNRR